MTDFEQLLTIDQAAELLNLPKSYLYEKSRLGKMPSIKIGKYRRFRASELQEWLDSINE